MTLIFAAGLNQSTTGGFKMQPSSPHQVPTGPWSKCEHDVLQEKLMLKQHIYQRRCMTAFFEAWPKQTTQDSWSTQLRRLTVTIILIRQD